MNRFKERFILLRPITIPFILYIGTLVLSTSWIENNQKPSLNFYIALLPLIQSIWMAVMLVRYIDKLDELERKIINEAAAFSFMITFMMILAFGFLTLAGIQFPHPSIISILMALLLIIGKIRGNRRYK